MLRPSPGRRFLESWPAHHTGTARHGTVWYGLASHGFHGFHAWSKLLQMLPKRFPNVVQMLPKGTKQHIILQRISNMRITSLLGRCCRFLEIRNYEGLGALSKNKKFEHPQQKMWFLVTPQGCTYISYVHTPGVITIPGVWPTPLPVEGGVAPPPPIRPPPSIRPPGVVQKA